MGTLIIWAIISTFVGLFSYTLSLENGGNGGFLLVIAIILNVATVIRMFHKKSSSKRSALEHRKSYILLVSPLLLSHGLSCFSPAKPKRIWPQYLSFLVSV